MTHTSTEQELKDIEQALRLAREAHQHEVDAYRPELYKPECDRRPKYQLDRLGDLICLLQNILYAAQQASRRAQVVPEHDRCPLCRYQHGHAIGCKRNPVDIALAAAPQPPESNSAEFDRIEAATVQMPEPVGVLRVFEPHECAGVVCTEATINATNLSHGWHTLYTEHQVRQLLAQHGIK